jgi:uncharacterized protein YndB with AHSA1/START domain
MTDVADRVALGGDAGELSRIEGGWALRFERRLRHSPERVWRALTTPEGLACWLAEAKIDVEPGGRMDLHFRQPDHEFMPDVPERRMQHNEVLVARPFTRFEHTFGGNPDSIVVWTLTPDGDGTLLRLEHRVPESWTDARRNVLSGWHHHMEGLEDACALTRHTWDWDRWFALRDAYAERIGQAEAGGEYSNDWTKTARRTGEPA